MAKITVSFMREVHTMMDKEEISYSRMVEMLNEEAQRKCEGNCGMNYCDTNGCMERVKIPTDPVDFNDKFQELYKQTGPGYVVKPLPRWLSTPLIPVNCAVCEITCYLHSGTNTENYICNGCIYKSASNL